MGLSYVRTPHVIISREEDRKEDGRESRRRGNQLSSPFFILCFCHFRPTPVIFSECQSPMKEIETEEGFTGEG
ncbi:hypothetical protein KFK09_024214 [Dendrobium nobile]|uniref:Uncharacterized protein n=1 Tax=Dendrobium nobile TaxID=94219 RepID=A0A8T3ADF0_DENNO|nr:hypothetical protein KFK09_024214 [Dendrobium nobile]